MVMRVSKYRHIFGEELPEKLLDLKPNALSSEGSLLSSNGTNTAIAWESANAGILAVFNMSEAGRVPVTHPLIKGHAAPLTDFRFNPFHEFQIMTGSNDCTLKLWQVPEEGLTEDLTQPRLDLHSHTKKVLVLDFHPCAGYVVASTSLDKTVKVWDLVNATVAREVGPMPEAAFSLAWSPHGTLLGGTYRDLVCRVFDIRNQADVTNFALYDGSKPSKMTWITETTLVATGFSRHSGRQIGLWDIRNTDVPVTNLKLDQGAGVLYPYFDCDTNVLFVCGKGEGSIKFFEINEGLQYLNAYNTTHPSRGFDFVPKRKVNTEVCEIMRCVKLTGNCIEQVSLRVPRKAEGFQDDLFPPCISGQPALSSEEWLSGSNAEPPRMDFREGIIQTAVMETPKTVQEYEKELAAANERIRELEEELKQVKEECSRLRNSQA